MPKNTTPTPIVDKNGKSTTVHKNTSAVTVTRVAPRPRKAVIRPRTEAEVDIYLSSLNDSMDDLSGKALAHAEYKVEILEDIRGYGPGDMMSQNGVMAYLSDQHGEGSPSHTAGNEVYGWLYQGN
jgi:hypothetical protein